MTIKLTSAAVAAVSSVALIFSSQPVHAAEHKTEHKTTKTTVKPAAKPAKPVEPAPVIVQAGDSLSSIAEAHDTTYVRLFNANETIGNPDLINPGDKLRLPKAEEQLPDRFASVVAPAAPAQSTSYAAGSSYAPQGIHIYSSSTGNTYYQGQCTWYAKSRRPDLPNMLGNGGQWVANAAARGYATGSAPRAGAVAEQAGHVAYVESVNGDGTVNISEMNYGGGVGVVHNRTVAASTFKYIY